MWSKWPARISAFGLLLILFALIGCAASRSQSNDIQTKNVVPDAALRLRDTYWHPVGPTIRITSTGKGGSGMFSLTGSGGRSGYQYAISVPIAVAGGRTYIVAGDVDARGVLSGRPEWAIMDTQGHVIAFAAISSGLSARVTQSFLMPKNVNEVRVICDSVDAVVARGEQLTFSFPELRLVDEADYSGNTRSSTN